MSNEIKVFKFKKGYQIKRKNKRIVIGQSKQRPDTLFLQVAVFEKEDGHFAQIDSERGIKHVVIRLTEETAELTARYLMQYLTDRRNEKQ